MSDTFAIKRNDTSPAIVRFLEDEAGAAINLDSASVRFYMGSSLAGAATVLDAATGQVAYEWLVGDTAIAGTHRAEFEVVYSDGSKETFPNTGYITVNITPDLGEPA